MSSAVFSHLTATPNEIEPAGQALATQAAGVAAAADEMQRALGQLEANWQGDASLHWVPALRAKLNALAALADLLRQVGTSLKSVAGVYQETDARWASKFEDAFTHSAFADVPPFPGGE